VAFVHPVGAVAASEQGEVEAFDAIQTPMCERRVPLADLATAPSLFALSDGCPFAVLNLAFALRHGSKKKDAEWRVACILRSVASGRYFFFLF
jgi:hypothetical protein